MPTRSPPPEKRTVPIMGNPLPPRQVKGPPSMPRDKKVAGPRIPGSMMTRLKLMHQAHQKETGDEINFADWYANLLQVKIFTK